MRYPKLVAALAALTLTVGGLALAGPALAADEPVPAPTTEVASSPDTPDLTPKPIEPSSVPSDGPTSEVTKAPTPEMVTPTAESPAVPTPPTETTAAPGSSAKAPAPSSTSVDTSAKASPSESPAAKPGKGHDPVTLCHKPGTPAQQTLTVDDNAVKGHLGHGDTLGECAPVVVTPPVVVPVEGWWIMPNGGTADNVTWPQTATTAGSVPCGMTAQVDLYPSAEVLATLAADGILEQGEDYSTVISWRFVYGGDCPPTPGPANPAATIAVQCGLGTVTVTNDGENILTASVVIYLDGDFLTALAVPAGETVTTPVGFAEDSGDHILTARTGPAFGDVELATATVSSDCVEPPVVVVPPTEPPVVVTPPTTPTVTPSVVPDVTPAPVAVETVSAERLASTGSDTDAARVIVWVAAALVLAGIVVLLVIRRRTPKQK